VILVESLDFADKFFDSLTDNILFRRVLTVLSYVHIEYSSECLLFSHGFVINDLF